MGQYKFKYNKITQVWSRVLLRSNGKDVPYQNELILTPAPDIAGFPKTMGDIKKLNFVKYFHQHQPQEVLYFPTLPNSVNRRLMESCSETMYSTLIHLDFTDRLIHIHMPSGFIVPAKECVRFARDLLEGDDRDY